MLAPMQGLTNRGLRRLFIELVRPDVVFTEFIQVRKAGSRVISPGDQQEVRDTAGGVVLVVQLIGSEPTALADAACLVQDLGARHLNINLGCPYGRMGRKSAGGNLLSRPRELEKILQALRPVIRGSFSLKLRTGFDSATEIFPLLPMFADCGVDFLVVHARTVAQRYSGSADHSVTARVVQESRLPVIANGDIFSAPTGRRVLEQTRAAGLMLGRGAIGDPWLFQRLRGRYPEESTSVERAGEVREYLEKLLTVYRDIFCGEQQVLAKVKEVLAYINDPELKKTIRTLRKARSESRFLQILAQLPDRQ